MTVDEFLNSALNDNRCRGWRSNPQIYMLAARAGRAGNFSNSMLPPIATFQELSPGRPRKLRGLAWSWLGAVKRVKPERR